LKGVGGKFQAPSRLCIIRYLKHTILGFGGHEFKSILQRTLLTSPPSYIIGLNKSRSMRCSLVTLPPMIRWQKATLLVVPLWLLSAIGCQCSSDALPLCTPSPYFDTHDYAVCPIDAAGPIWASKSLGLGWFVKGDACHGLGPGQFCTFSHPKFNRGLGVALITTDATVQDLSSWLILQPEDASSEVLAAVPPYEAQQIPGKGVGLIANRDIKQGELILARTPAVVVDGAAFNNLSTAHLTRLLAHAIEALPHDHQRDYLQLTTHDDARTYEERVYKIFAKNNFRTKFKNGKEFHSTFTEG
jgi:hypothetical protein